ncbi:MAG: hypothetical protein V4560_14700 [Bacteroidota bacterium]
MMQFLEFTFRSLWHFVGVFLILSLIIGYPFSVINRQIKHTTLREKGYPPAHCDVDGDFPKKEGEDD